MLPILFLDHRRYIVICPSKARFSALLFVLAWPLFPQRRRRPLALQLDFAIQSVVYLDEGNLRGAKWGLFLQ